jgi:hypothetical protein
LIVRQASAAATTRAFADIADLLDALRFVIPGTDWDAAEMERRRLVGVIRQHLLPRVADPEAPVVAVVAGPSGAGKSSVVNSLAQDEIGTPGAVRPATSRPAVWAHPDHDVLSEASFLRRFQAVTSGQVDLAVSDDGLVAEMVVVDTPPLDMGDESGRQLAQLTAAMADLAIFVTSQRRYADADSWDFLRFCQRRGLPVLFVVNRLDPDTRADLVLDDFAARLHSAGLLTTPDDTLLFAIYDHDDVEWHGGLPASSVAALRKELGELSDPTFRSALVTEATQSSGRSVVRGLASIVPQFRNQLGLVSDLRRRVDASYADVAKALVGDLESGAFAELSTHELWTQVAADLTGIVTHRAGVASQMVAESWSSTPHGAALLGAGGQSLWRHGHETTTTALEQLTDWQTELERLATEFTRRGKLSERRARKVQRAVWPVVLDFGHKLPRFVRRKYRHLAVQLVTTARRRLGELLTKSLLADAERFAEFLPEVDPEAAERVAALGVEAEAILDMTAQDPRLGDDDA